MVVNDGKIEVRFEEPGKCDDVTSGLDYESLPESMLGYGNGQIFFERSSEALSLMLFGFV